MSLSTKICVKIASVNTYTCFAALTTLLSLPCAIVVYADWSLCWSHLQCQGYFLPYLFGAIHTLGFTSSTKDVTSRWGKIIIFMKMNSFWKNITFQVDDQDPYMPLSTIERPRMGPIGGATPLPTANPIYHRRTVHTPPQTPPYHGTLNGHQVSYFLSLCRKN